MVREINKRKSKVPDEACFRGDYDIATDLSRGSVVRFTAKASKPLHTLGPFWRATLMKISCFNAGRENCDR